MGPDKHTQRKCLVNVCKSQGIKERPNIAHTHTQFSKKGFEEQGRCRRASGKQFTCTHCMQPHRFHTQTLGRVCSGGPKRLSDTPPSVFLHSYALDAPIRGQNSAFSSNIGLEAMTMGLLALFGTECSSAYASQVALGQGIGQTTCRCKRTVAPHICLITTCAFVFPSGSLASLKLRTPKVRSPRFFARTGATVWPRVGTRWCLAAIVARTADYPVFFSGHAAHSAPLAS